ncbi:MAG TPA: hypothetical protein VGW38_24305 [Chloroflexota bacterium]|nr:hypothetical protein [Chloroflexota bacterium]
MKFIPIKHVHMKPVHWEGRPAHLAALVALVLSAGVWRDLTAEQRQAIHNEWRGLGLEFVRAEPSDSSGVTRVIYRRPRGWTSALREQGA